MNGFRRILAVCLLAGIFLYIPAQAAKLPADPDPMVRIGLAYGSDARPAPKLLNRTGQATGYDFGWYDEDGAFQAVGETDVRDLVILKDKVIYLSAGENYSDRDAQNSIRTIQPYHLETEKTFQSYAKAQAAADGFREEGVTAFPAYHEDAYTVRVGEYGSSSAARLAASEMEELLDQSLQAVGGSATCYTVAKCSSGEILFEFDQKGQPLGIQPHSEETWFAGYSYNGGFEYNRVNGNDLTVINVVGIHGYVKGVITGEMSPSWPIEALKAQALCAKSYAYCSRGKHAALGFDLCNTTDCQVYQGTRQQNSNSNQAVDAVYGLFVLYKGNVVPTFYHASSGGWTEDAENVWGTPQGYLKAVEDVYLTQTLPYSFIITNSEIQSILKAKGYSLQADIADFYVSEQTAAGNVRAVTFVQKNGKELTLTGEKARTVLNNSSYGYQIKSQRFTVTPVGSGSTGEKLPINGTWITAKLRELFAIGGSGRKQLRLDAGSAFALTGSGIVPLSGLSETTAGSTGSGTYRVTGTGSGHNVGMSQWGARAMAEKGFDYEEILHFYFTDIDIGRPTGSVSAY